jgi:DNA-binding LacI/PurR family transcriptional regulator
MNIDHRSVSPVLDKIDPNKLLVLDMGNTSGRKMNYLIQDFHTAVFQCLEKGLPQLNKYDELIMVYSEKDTPHPAESVTAVTQFCKNHQITFRKINRVNAVQFKKGQAWFVIRDADLVEVIKICRANKLKLGQDVGVLSYNDSPMKQIVGGGISVMSVDFEKMGELAARFVKNKQPIEKVLPTFLTLRASL